MKHVHYLFGLLVICATASAGDYVLRVEAVGFVDVDATAKAPAESVIWAIEALATPGAPFYTTATIGKKTLVVRGKMQPRDSGALDIELHCTDITDRFDELKPNSGNREHAICRSTLSTNLTLELGKPATLGGCDTTSASADAARLGTRSRTRHVVTVRKYESE